MLHSEWLAGLRKQLQAAQEHARSVQQAQALAASELEGFNHQQHEWQHRMAAAQAELAQLQKWIDMSQVSPGAPALLLGTARPWLSQPAPAVRAQLCLDPQSGAPAGAKSPSCQP